MTSPDPRAQRAYKLYIEDGLSMAAVRHILHADRRRVRGWIVELGGEIRQQGYCSADDRDTATQVGPAQTGWRADAGCSIGHSKRGTYSMGDSWYCSRHCGHGRCKEEATVQDLAAFARLGKAREADHKLIAERKKKKLSGGALWRGGERERKVEMRDPLTFAPPWCMMVLVVNRLPFD